MPQGVEHGGCLVTQAPLQLLSWGGREKGGNVVAGSRGVPVLLSTALGDCGLVTSQGCVPLSPFLTHSQLVP